MSRVSAQPLKRVLALWAVTEVSATGSEHRVPNTVHTEIQVPSADDPELSKTFSVHLGICQNIALYA